MSEIYEDDFIESFLSPEEVLFAAELRDFFSTEISPATRDKYAHEIPLSRDEVIAAQQAMNEAGLATPRWPVEWGGRNWTAVQHHLWLREMARADVPPPLPFNVTLIGPIIAAYGSETQKERFLGPTANLDIWWCQGFSEPGAGSDLAALTTSAVRDGDSFIVNGQKTWTTYAQSADWIFCLVRTDPDVAKQAGISMLLIDMRSPGVTVRPIQLIEGGFEVNEVFFDDVRVPADQVVGEENCGWTYAKFLLENERIGTTEVGLSKARVRRARRLAATTMVDGGPLLASPLFHARLTRLEIELTALEFSVLRAIGDDGVSGSALPSILKLKGTELQQRATELLVDVAGPRGVIPGPELRRGAPDRPERDAGGLDALGIYFNWRKATIYGGSSEIQRELIARSVLKG